MAKISNALLWAIASLFWCLLLPGGAQAANHIYDDQWTFDNGVLKSCDGIPANAAFKGTLTLLRRIECELPTSIAIVGDTVIRSHSDIDTTNLAFDVMPGAHVIFSAPTVTLKRSELMKKDRVGILSVHGTVEFQVQGWVSSHLDGSLTDQYGLMSFGHDGYLRSTKVGSVHFTLDSIIAANPAAANTINDFDIVGSELPQDPVLREDLTARHLASLASDGDAEPTSTNTVVPAIAGMEEAADETASSALPPIRAPSTPDVEGGPDADTATHAADEACKEDTVVAPSAAAGSPAPSFEQRLAAGGNGESGGSINHWTQSRTGTSKSERDSGASGQSASGGDRTDTGLSRSSWTTKEPQRLQNRRTGRSNNNNNNNNNNNGDSRPFSKQLSNRSNIGNSNGSSDGGDSGRGSKKSRAPPIMNAHPGLSLKVGENLKDVLVSSDQKAMLYASPVDARVIFGKVAAEAPLSASGRDVGFFPKSAATLMAPDPKKMARASDIRAEIIEEAQRGPGKKRKFAAVMKLMPFGKAGWRRARARKHAQAHLGEVELKVTDRGVLEASLDGSTVAKRCGPSWFGRRKKDPSYEVRVTETGLEITRRGKVDWRIDAEDIFDF